MLTVRAASLAFGGIQALNDVSFIARAGEITAIIGPNGAGKTSLFNIISGFYRPQRGQILIGDQDITGLRPDKRAQWGLARTFQNLALFRGMSVLDNIKLGGHIHLSSGFWSSGWFYGRAQREEAELRAVLERDVIDFLELDHIRNAPVAALPYGLQKRVELGRALAMRPQILMLDEPVAGMNREETEDMARFILDIQERWGTTILLVEHDMGMVMDLSNQVVVLNFGRQIALGTPQEVQQHPEVIAAYLGTEAAALHDHSQGG
ncbi:ABC transporter ATP-binding protein [Salinispirillum marinum]|uniref:ABC transporter ATP-binding protein n=2 Tax=Saccharospirillaceae TaxID=255527 RepID=A0ABV8BK36_9GAMM